jgi:hypothetical protein
LPLLNVAASRGLVAVAFSNVCIFGPTSFQCLDAFTECGLASLVDSQPRRVSSAIFAGLRKLHPSKPVTSNAAPKTPPGNSPRVCAYGANVAAICLFGGKNLPGALRTEARPAPLRLAVAGVALRGLVFQSPNKIYQSDPFCPRFARIAPPHLNALVSVFRARKTAAPSTPNPQTISAMWISSGSVSPGPSHGARYGVSGAALASLLKDQPKTLARGMPTPKNPAR